MAVAVVSLVIAGLAAVAIERAVKAGRLRSEADWHRSRAEGYRRVAAKLKHEMQRMQAAQTAAVETLEVAIEHGDPRSALGVLARLPEESGVTLSHHDTDSLLADEVAAEIAADRGRRGLPTHKGLLGRLLGGAGSSVGDQGGSMDESSRTRLQEGR